jgi:hypothetical protein
MMVCRYVGNKERWLLVSAANAWLLQRKRESGESQGRWMARNVQVVRWRKTSCHVLWATAASIKAGIHRIQAQPSTHTRPGNALVVLKNNQPNPTEASSVPTARYHHNHTVRRSQ